MGNFIPLSIPCLGGNEWAYIKECLDTNWVSSAGKYVDRFEQRIAEYTGSKYAVACVNGTAALQVGLRLAGVKPGDEVIVPTLTFIAPINATVYLGAKPVFMDADEFYNIDVEKTVHFILEQTEFRGGSSYNRTTGSRISAIIPVHIWGNACRLNELVNICEERNIAVVEDSSESLGTKYISGSATGRHTGTVGKLGCISFNGNKIITTGGGGMLLTDSEKMADKAKYLTTQAKDDPIKYIHDEIGYNYRMTNIQAALGVAQLEQLEAILIKKREIYENYEQYCRSIEGLTLAEVPEYAINNHWLNVLQIDFDKYGSDRDEVMEKLEVSGIQTRPIWYLNHLQKPYRDCQNYMIENAVELYQKSLCIPSSPSLDNFDLGRIQEALRE